MTILVSLLWKVPALCSLVMVVAMIYRRAQHSNEPISDISLVVRSSIIIVSVLVAMAAATAIIIY